ncbi:MAG: hypothetical protein IRY99_03430 [Isosphaeraceae bacterium]|nr:hypothetical protein [Isosphaeraceae bacterium]
MSNWNKRARLYAYRLAVEAEYRRRRAGAKARDAERRARHRMDPVAYCEEVLGLRLWGKQKELLRALCRPPHRVLCRSANGVGKTFLAAAALVWFYDTREHCMAAVTAPTARQVELGTFKEVRRLLGDRPGLYPKSPRIASDPFHVLFGFTATSEASFQGLRDAANLLVFEEAVGIDSVFWGAARGVLAGGQEALWLAILNPTNPSCAAKQEEDQGNWTVLRISAFEHPNIVAELAGEPPPFPAAVRLTTLIGNMTAWGEWIAEAERTTDAVDLLDPATYGLAELPVEALSGAQAHWPARYWRPTTPDGDARVLGQYPRQSAYAVYLETAFDWICHHPVDYETGHTIVFGCDVARYGDDNTEIHGQRHGHALVHEVYHGQNTQQTAGRLKQLCREWAPRCYCEPWEIPCYIDDTGVGGGVTDQAYDAESGRRFRFIAVNGQSEPREPDKYPNLRSEAHFTLAEKILKRRVSLAELPWSVRAELKRQALTILYRLDNQGRRVVEPKEQAKKRLRRSPDGLDAMILAHYGPTEEQGFHSEPVLLRPSETPTQRGWGRMARP